MRILEVLLTTALCILYTSVRAEEITIEIWTDPTTVETFQAFDGLGKVLIDEPDGSQRTVCMVYFRPHTPKSGELVQLDEDGNPYVWFPTLNDWVPTWAFTDLYVILPICILEGASQMAGSSFCLHVYMLRSSYAKVCCIR
jgi:hypothetical protein